MSENASTVDVLELARTIAQQTREQLEAEKQKARENGTEEPRSKSEQETFYSQQNAVGLAELRVAVLEQLKKIHFATSPFGHFQLTNDNDSDVFALLEVLPGHGTRPSSGGHKVAWFKACIAWMPGGGDPTPYVWARVYPPSPYVIVGNTVMHDGTWDLEECRPHDNGAATLSCTGMAGLHDFLEALGVHLAEWL